MQAVITFSIQNDLLPNLRNLTNFFSQFGMFCNHYPCWCCNCFFQAIGLALANMQNVFNNTADFFCMDISNAKSQFYQIKTSQGGIFIVFDRMQPQKYQYLGQTRNFRQYIHTIMNGRNGTLLNRKNISKSSILFLGLKMLNQTNSFGAELKKLRSDIETHLQLSGVTKI